MCVVSANLADQALSLQLLLLKRRSMLTRFGDRAPKHTHSIIILFVRRVYLLGKTGNKQVHRPPVTNIVWYYLIVDFVLRLLILLYTTTKWWSLLSLHKGTRFNLHLSPTYISKTHRSITYVSRLNRVSPFYLYFHFSWNYSYSSFSDIFTFLSPLFSCCWIRWSRLHNVPHFVEIPLESLYDTYKNLTKTKMRLTTAVCCCCPEYEIWGIPLDPREGNSMGNLMPPPGSLTLLEPQSRFRDKPVKL